MKEIPKVPMSQTSLGAENRPVREKKQFLGRPGSGGGGRKNKSENNTP